MGGGGEEGVMEKEGEIERQREGQRHRETETQKERETETERARAGEGEGVYPGSDKAKVQKKTAIVLLYLGWLNVFIG